MSASIPTSSAPPQDAQILVTPDTIDWSLGWRYETIRTPTGKLEEVRIPLTPDEALHPKEGYVMPQRIWHDHTTDNLGDMLRPHCEQQPGMAVFHDLIFEWDHPQVRPYAPDIAVVPNVRNREADRGTFVVAQEGTRPTLIIEVVSPASRIGDRKIKFQDYARVGVQEYIYIDHWTRRDKEVWEIAGFRLSEGQYLPLIPDEDGAYYCETVNIRIGIEDGEVWVEDANTGQDLLTNLRIRQALQMAEVRAAEEEDARIAAEARATAEEEARISAEARIAALEAELQVLRKQQTTGQSSQSH